MTPLCGTSLLQVLSPLCLIFTTVNLCHSSSPPRFQKSGEPFVMVDDVVAPIGWTGPTWIKKELNYTRTAQGAIEVQSWTFVVGESPIKSKLLPTGMHYCKLLSPARCMEWIYTDGLRTKMGTGSKAE